MIFLANDEEKIEMIKADLNEVQTLLHKDVVVWPYQKLDLKKFTHKFFPHLTTQEAEKYFRYKPQQFMSTIENKLKGIDTILRPRETHCNALEFQLRLFDFFSIYSPKKLKACQKILTKTPRGIREAFFSEKTLKLATKKEFNQKQISELLAHWLNMRYYGAMSMGLSPLFLSEQLNSPDKLEEKKKGIEKAIAQLKPEIENKWVEYDRTVFVKERLDEERKMMTFGPESIKRIKTSLELTYTYSVTGEITKEESLEITHLVKEIVNEAVILGKKEGKTLISEENNKEINELMEKIIEKPRLFFTIARTTNFTKKGIKLNEEQETTLQKIIRLGKLLPDNTEEALKHEEIKKSFGIIFEPLENLLHVEDLDIESKKNGKKREKTDESGLELLKDAIEGIATWILKRIIDEEKKGMLNILELFNGIPPILGSDIVKLIRSKKVKIDKEKFKEYLIEHLSSNGVYEIYSELSGGEADKTKEIEVASEIIIPPQPDQRLAPILKQIKFEFMKFLENHTISTKNKKNQPLFDVLEIHKIIPNNVVEVLLEITQDMLISIINLNASNSLHELIKVDKNEYEVRLKTVSLKLKSLINRFTDSLNDIVKKLEVYKLSENVLLSEFKGKIKDIWIDELTKKKKIEIKETDISTSAVSSIAAKLMAKKPVGFKGPPKGIAEKILPKIPPKGPPIGPPKGPPVKLSASPPQGPPKGSPIGPPKGPPVKLSAGPPSNLPPTSQKIPPIGMPSKISPGPPKIPPNGVPTKLPPGPPKGTEKIAPNDLQLITDEITPAPTKPKQVFIKEKEKLTKPKPIKSVDKPVGENLIKQIEDSQIELEEQLPEMMMDSIKHFPSLLQNTSTPEQMERNLIILNEEDQKKILVIKKTIKEVEDLLGDYEENPEKFSPEEIRRAFKLLAKVHRLDLKKVTPNEIREVISLAEDLKTKKDIIAAQVEHLKSLNIEQKLSQASLKTLESKLELILRYFEDYIQEIYKFIDYLGKKTSSYLKEYQKKSGDAFWKQQRIKKASITLSKNLIFIIELSKLSDDEIKNANKYFQGLIKSRESNQRKKTGQMAKKLGDLIGIEKKEVLQMTRESEELIIAIEDVFKVRIKN